jgi:hypothetical protein
MLLPRTEIDNYLLTVSLAAQLAREGKAHDGYTVLGAGLRHAQQALADGQPAGEELVRRWRQALKTYATRHGLCLPQGA